MANLVKVKGKVRELDVKQSIDNDGNHKQEVSVKFAYNKRPNSPQRTPNRPTGIPRQPNAIRYNVGDKHAKAQTDNKQTEA